MCLHLDKKLHPKNKVRIAQRDILVYKTLELPTHTYAYSPYRGAEWTFGRKKTYSRIKIDKRYEVHAGLHACTTTFAATKHVASYYGGAVYPAIIPKGSQVIYGTDDDIVSDAMIVYRTLDDLEAKHGKIGYGVAKNTIAK